MGRVLTIPRSCQLELALLNWPKIGQHQKWLVALVDLDEVLHDFVS
jgi:hypothetical protein